eukprot:TRINITY_DN122474_c0_g1_i1.p1 TRINITY_DN122474_c0_g1~~TRINITY_DN122474_c0_g1_i1.p1  ORF type:complete len:333 (-),score=57.95 TRINITY_DN122474_c0_g1_i1:305-1249(-)
MGFGEGPPHEQVLDPQSLHAARNVLQPGEQQEHARDAEADALKVWYDACLRFFVNSHTESRALLEFFDAHCLPGTAPLAVDGGTAPVLLLERCGLVDRGGVTIALTAERHAAYTASRNRARSAMHAEAAKQRRERLYEQLRRLSQDNTSELPKRLTQEDFRSRLTAFVTSHGQQLGVHPFIKGFRTLLETQLGNPNVWRWWLREELFMEAAGDAFMNDALALLMRFFRFVPLEELAEAGVDANGGKRLAWEVASELSDPHVRRLLSLLPSMSRLEGGPAGEFVVTTSQRTNMHGELDDPEGVRALLLSLPCTVL